MDIATILIPMFLMMGVGYGYRVIGWRIDPDGLTDLIMNLLMPCLVFSALLETGFTPSRLGWLGLANILLVFGLLGLGWVVSKFLNEVPGSFYLPILFMNAGFIGIPLLKFYGGESAMASVIIFDQVQSLMIFTLGLALVTAGYPLSRQVIMFLKEPIVGAIVAGLLLPILPWRPAGGTEELLGAALEAVSTIGEATIPVALFLVGYVLHRLKPTVSPAVVAGTSMRLIVSPLMGIGICFGLGLSGPDAAAVFLASALPSAVFSYVLAQRYDQDPGYAAGVVFYTSVATIVSLPVVLAVAYQITPPPN